jgi:hypothetical protein
MSCPTRQRVGGGSKNQLMTMSCPKLPEGNDEMSEIHALAKFPRKAVMPLIVKTREVVHAAAPEQAGDLINEIRRVAPDWVP